MRFPTGVSRDRFNLITAVLAKHARLKVCSTICKTNVKLVGLRLSQWTEEAMGNAAVHTADCHVVIHAVPLAMSCSCTCVRFRHAQMQHNTRALHRASEQLSLSMSEALGPLSTPPHRHGSELCCQARTCRPSTHWFNILILTSLPLDFFLALLHDGLGSSLSLCTCKVWPSLSKRRRTFQ